MVVQRERKESETQYPKVNVNDYEYVPIQIRTTDYRIVKIRNKKNAHRKLKRSRIFDVENRSYMKEYVSVLCIRTYTYMSISQNVHT